MIARDGLRWTPLVPMDVAQVIVGLGERGIDAQRLFVAVGCLVQSALLLEGVAEIDMGLRKLRLYARSLRKVVQCLLAPAGRVQRQAQTGVDIRARGIGVKYLPV